MEIVKYTGKIIQVITREVELQNGTKFTAEIARRSPGVRLIIINEIGQILISKESRHELEGSYDYRLPGGKVFDKSEEWLATRSDTEKLNKAIEDCVVRECLEEVGLKPTKFEYFHRSVLGSTLEWDLYYYIVTKFESNTRFDNGEGEDISTEWVDLETAKEIALNEMSEERSALVLLRFLTNYSK